MLRQRTLRGPVQAIGIGLHSGQRVSLNIKPGPIDSGIVFRRVDLDPVVELPALAHRITDTRLNTTLSADVEGPGLQVSVHTIEHLMSALAGLGIDNAQIDITASEVPILDGSAGSFVYLLQSAGLEEQAAPKRFIRILKPVEIVDGDKWVRLEPHEGMKFSFEIAFGQAAIDATGQRIEIDFATTSYVQEIARARTFVMASEVELLRKHGLALGGSLDNAIVADGVADIFALAGLDKPNIRLLSDEFLEDVRRMESRNLAVELLEKLLRDEIKTNTRNNVVQEKKYSDLLLATLNKYHNRGIETAQVIEELKKLGRPDILVTAGGVIPAQDYEFLYNAGVAAIFGPGTPVAYSAAKVLEILLGEEA